MEQIRKLVFYKTYFFEFFEKQEEKVKEKIDFGLYLLQYVKQIPSKHIGSTQEKNLFYLRIKQGSNIFRIFFCYDSGKVVVIMNGFAKKSQKIPANEIGQAIKIKKEYFNEK
ncbi:type II toxin-antitoxin system RelE/ParE family toxin [Dokdonella sp.]|uniref:type II toxin-antitoxin system RelE/ParE family toxin n=1 Tax=Dokdonella sp. TaxID=2291710 RepID=UPI002DD6A890|nr:type II toxin-antitoxin system RelE/ParE family toxin [Dokdonella sp.]